jgi:hypothetical protein
MADETHIHTILVYKVWGSSLRLFWGTELMSKHGNRARVSENTDGDADTVRNRTFLCQAGEAVVVCSIPCNCYSC